MVGLSSRTLVEPFTQRLLAVDLPGLTSSQRIEVTAFTVHRVDALPSALRIGVTAIAVPMRLVLALSGNSLMSWLIRHPLPLIGEYVRMVRSLTYTYVWEQWPNTLPDGTTPVPPG